MSETQGSTDISPKLKRIAKLAKDKPGVALWTLAHHIDVDWMREAFRCTRKDGATGTDGVDAETYGKQLEANLRSLVERAKSGAYRAPPVRRVHIPKGDGVQTRAIGIPTFEDKVLQRAVAMVLEAVYEQSFYDFSYGFRPGRSAHQALANFRNAAMGMGGGWIVEVDIKKYFDTIDHEHLQAILGQRVRDGVLLRLIGKWLNAGVLERNELSYPSEGTPQGGVISPLLANVFLHEIFDDWFARTIMPRLRGKCAVVRYADDIAMIFSSEGDAMWVLDLLPARFGSYGLTLHPEKTRLIGFRSPDLAARYGRPRPGTFDLLGFTHHWGLSHNKKWRVYVRTAKDRFSRTLRQLNAWCRYYRHDELKAQHLMLEKKLEGHYEYFGVSTNFRALNRVRYEAEWISAQMALAPFAPAPALDGDASAPEAVSASEATRSSSRRHVANLFLEEPDAGILQVRICGGPEKATTRGYPASWPSTPRSIAEYIFLLGSDSESMSLTISEYDNDCPTGRSVISWHCD